MLAKQISESITASRWRTAFVGCSTGGRGAMLMSQQSAYFDGIVAGARDAHWAFESGAPVAVNLNKIAPKAERPAFRRWTHRGARRHRETPRRLRCARRYERTDL
jgi:hypothetical protein